MHAGVALTQLDDVTVVGLTAPELAPAYLASWETINGHTAMTLCYGSWTEPRGPFVSVRTSTLPARDEPTLQSLLADERERLFEHAGIDEPEPVDANPGIAELNVDDAWLASTMRSEGDAWAGRVELPSSPGALVTVVSRSVTSPTIRLIRVDDLRPLWVAREQLLARLVEGQPPEVELPEAAGLEGHQALVGMVLARPHPLRAGRRERRLPPEWKARWDVATRAQARLAGQSEADAYEAVGAMVNQLSTLAERASWWGAHGPAAIAETIRYTVFESDVPSRSAQLTWQRRSRGPAIDNEWLAAWNAWAAAR